MPSVIWWILGLAVAGGTAFYYSDMGKKILMKDACISELPEPKKSEVLKAISDKNIPKLQTFAKNAKDEGFTCAYNEINDKIAEINKAVIDEKKAKEKAEETKCPTPEQVTVAVNDIKSGKLSIDGATKLVATLDKNGCKDQKKPIEDALIEKRKTGLLLGKDVVSAIFAGEIRTSLNGASEPDKVAIIDIIKQSQNSTVDYTKFPYESGKILAYADVAAKYKATKAENILRDVAMKVKNAIASSLDTSVKTATQIRAESDWPSIMSLPNSGYDVDIAKAAALRLKKVGAIGIGGDGIPAIHLAYDGPGLSVSIDRLNDAAKNIQDKYGDTFSEAVTELRLITNSLKRDLLE